MIAAVLIGLSTKTGVGTSIALHRVLHLAFRKNTALTQYIRKTV